MSWFPSSRAGLARALAGRLDRLRLTLDELGGRLREAVAAAVGTEVGGAARAAVRAALDAGPPSEVYGRPWSSRRPSPDRGGIWEDAYDRDYDGPGGLPPEEADDDAYDDNYAEPPPTPGRPRGARLAVAAACGLRALAWCLGRPGRTPLWATLLLGAAAAAAAYCGGTLLAARSGLGGASLGVAALTDLVRAADRALNWFRGRPDA
jgi:hypothetical protein